jgi:hypothetical protein
VALASCLAKSFCMTGYRSTIVVIVIV